MTKAREFRRFAHGVIQNYRALAAWVRRRRGRGRISPIKALGRRKKIDAKARVVLEVCELVPDLLKAQRALTDAIAEMQNVER